MPKPAAQASASAPVGAAVGIEKHRVECFKHQAAVHQRQGQQAGRGHTGHQQQAAVVHAERTAKQQVQQVKLGASP